MSPLGPATPSAQAARAPSLAAGCCPGPAGGLWLQGSQDGKQMRPRGPQAQLEAGRLGRKFA